MQGRRELDGGIPQRALGIALHSAQLLVGTASAADTKSLKADTKALNKIT
jgi:hypothetical protein